MIVSGRSHDQKLSKRKFQLQRFQAFELSLMNPVRVHPCGHTFCQQCSPRAGNPCFNCITVVIVSQPDLTSRNLIADLQVKCTAPGCPFRGTYQEYQSAHQQNCVIGRSGGLQNWMESMKYAVDNIKQQPIKHFEAQNQNSEFNQLDGDLEWQKEDNALGSKKNRSTERAQGKIKSRKNKEDEKFIECIPIDSRNQQQIECRQLDGGERFTQLYFNSHPKLLQSNHRKGKRVIELQ